MKRTVIMVVAVTWPIVALGNDSVVNSPHDLSALSRGPTRAVQETQVCVFCHTPHNAAPQTPLWNRHNSRTYYKIYKSSTLEARVDQPSGPSKMCLSCHDGMLALGAVLSEPEDHPLLTTPRTMPPGPRDLTTDLSDDHPIGFRYDRALALSDRQLNVPQVVSRALPLGRHGEVHCTTCHDPHDDELGNFLRVTDRYSAVCITCHDMNGWQHSSHALSRARVGRGDVDPREQLPYNTVGENGCTNCHKIHGASEAERLLRFRREELNCLNCHDGSVAKTNIASQIRKRSAHQVYWRTEVHDAAEDPYTMRRHVECQDCHNPHAVQPDLSSKNRGTRGSLVPLQDRFVSGMDRAGRPVKNATFLYEICFKCHADNESRPERNIRRQVQETNLRLDFDTANASFHPVVGPRRNSDVVSLMGPLRTGSMITCIDCHNSDEARSEGGGGPNGPHGSIYAPLLVANYTTADFTTESAQSYSLCYRCHDRNSILGNESFPLHQVHIVGARAPCSACHDAHGVSRGGSSGSDHTSLINFNLSIVQPADSAEGSVIRYEDTGRLKGNCTLTCHGVTHVHFPYQN